MKTYLVTVIAGRYEDGNVVARYVVLAEDYDSAIMKVCDMYDDFYNELDYFSEEIPFIG